MEIDKEREIKRICRIICQSTGGLSRGAQVLLCTANSTSGTVGHIMLWQMSTHAASGKKSGKSRGAGGGVEGDDRRT
jgi:hypothetical protein